MGQDRFEEVLKSKFREFEPENSSASSADWLLISQAIVSKKFLFGNLFASKGSAASTKTVVTTVATTAAVTAAVITGVIMMNRTKPKDYIKPPAAIEQQVDEKTKDPAPVLEAVEIFRRELARVNTPSPAEKRELAATSHVEEPQKSDEKAQNTTADRSRKAAQFDPVTNITSKKQPPKLHSGSNWSLALFAQKGFGIGGIGSGAVAANPGNSIIENNPENGQTASAKLNHKLPLTIGLNLIHRIDDRFSIEAGVSYSRLTSNAKLNALFDYELDQTVNYIGIPVGISYSALKSKRWEIYSRLGVEANFNTGSTRKLTVMSDNITTTQTDKFTMKGIQWASSLGVGTVYNITPSFGVYFEPGVVHYFPNDTPIETFWSENPTNVTLRIGLRTNF